MESAVLGRCIWRVVRIFLIDGTGLIESAIIGHVGHPLDWEVAGGPMVSVLCVYKLS